MNIHITVIMVLIRIESTRYTTTVALEKPLTYFKIVT